MKSSSAGTGRYRRVWILGLFLMAALMVRSPLLAQLKVLRIDPRETNSAIEGVHGPHLALYDPRIPSQHRLFVFLPGTGGKAEGAMPIAGAFAHWGYHSIALDYEDNVVAVTCARSTDAACFDHYRKAIVTGASVSHKIRVNRANSILSRLQALLAYLALHDPAGGWQEFLSHDQPAWKRIVIAGHSQGSGHAAYIGKLFAVDRVLMFSGPQDFLVTLNKPAPWLLRHSATPPSRYFAFLNWKDPFDVHHQIANCMALMDLTAAETQVVEAGKPIEGRRQILITKLLTPNPHGSTVQPRFSNVWRYMAGTTPQ
ncbi:MAG: BPSS1187 family protein [Acidobacteriota bacterium]